MSVTEIEDEIQNLTESIDLLAKDDSLVFLDMRIQLENERSVLIAWLRKKID